MIDDKLTDARGRLVTLRMVDDENWRSVADVVPHDGQRDFVAPSAARYLLLSFRESTWNSLAVCADDRVVGHVMWGWDPDDRAYWIGGMMVDASEQGKGVGRAALRLLVDRLRGRDDCRRIRLSFDENNTSARGLYASMGFVELPEREGDEIIGELSFDPAREAPSL